MWKKMIFISALFLILLFYPLKAKAISVEDARTVIANYANFIYDEHRNEYVYSINEEGIDYTLPYEGKYNKNNKYAMDCSKFVYLTIFNAFQANKKSEFSFMAYHGQYSGKDDKWKQNSIYYDEETFDFKDATETMKEAVNRHDIISKAKPGDLIGFIAYNDEGNSYAHIALYVGNGYYIHNTGEGLKKSKLPNEVSFGNRHGKNVNGKIIGGISILKLKNTEGISSSVLNSYRYYDGYGNVKYKSVGGGSYESPSNYDADELSIDYNNEFTKIAYFSGLIVFILRIAVPIALLIWGIIDLIKVITTDSNLKSGGDPTSIEMKKIVKRIALKFVFAAVVFILPTVILTLLKLVNQNSLSNKNVSCLLKPLECDVRLWD